MKHKIFFYIFLSFLYSQNIDMYLSLLHEGQVDGVRENLPELISKYPNNPDVLYLKALLTKEGLSAVEQYQSILEHFPESRFAPDAAMKIGEYFYARGLYTQAAALLRTLPVKYPRYIQIQRATDLMVNSFLAIGETDSARYYALVLKSMYPGVDVEQYGLSEFKQPASQVFDLKKKVPELRPYVIQIGAFGNQANANRLKLQVSQIGYEVIINPLESNGKKFHAVRIVRFKSKREAERIGNEIKKKLGTDFRILYRPMSQK
jgi:tetratricopeptide (TPR) repeat protein|tara:strand:- start:244 stop:1029 length:786 start_codon:yes stop_codon:yes gene_type:complete